MKLALLGLECLQQFLDKKRTQHDLQQFLMISERRKPKKNWTDKKERGKKKMPGLGKKKSRFS